ncbi:hypothetical protein PRUPE_6G199200 [Prunus persica]|uniref:NB-ARC domain-containing protein n=1 Tax=Prunus persica TaxID=3760 RepID=A0A251NT32_PRUPE|nr:hypothetical protein PRUPE_6G199200 [Prunus persica]
MVYPSHTFARRRVVPRRAKAFFTIFARRNMRDDVFVALKLGRLNATLRDVFFFVAQKPMKSILLLSFNDLPYRLKQCFLYCCLFPEDHVIVNHRLIRLWIAEGFVEHVKGVTPEEVAKSYIMGLVFRNMLQEMYRDYHPACKMHDLLREIALSIAKKEKFCVVHDGSETVEEIGALRLSIQTTNGEIGSCTGISRLRSFLVFATGLSSFSFSNKSPFDLKLLKVLDLEDVPLDNLPDNLTSISGKAIGVRIPSSISKMKKLQSLAYIESEGNIIRLIGSMTQLTLLGITNVKERDEEDLCASIQEMKLMERNFFELRNFFEDRLYLSGKLEKVKHWFCSLHCLTDLFLGDSRLEENLLPHIEALRSLRLLCLDNSSIRKESCFSRGFVNLRYLEVLNFSFLNKITIEKGVMSNLEFLDISKCLRLETLPQGIEHLTKLQGYVFESVSKQFTESIREGGVDKDANCRRDM